MLYDSIFLFDSTNLKFRSLESLAGVLYHDKGLRQIEIIASFSSVSAFQSCCPINFFVLLN